MSQQLHGYGTPPPTKPIQASTGMIIAAGVIGGLVLIGIALRGWPMFGLWIAGFVPVVYGVIQLVRRRGRRGLVAIGVGMLAGIVALSTLPPDSAIVAEPASSTTGHSSAGAESTRSSTPSPSPTASTPATPSPSPRAKAPTRAAEAPATTAAPRSTKNPTAAATPKATTKAPAKLTTAQQTVVALAVKGRGPKTGYDRNLFRWNGYDFDRNGCDQRNDVLKRDMHRPVIKPGSNGCRVEAGWLQDRYSGTAIYLPREKVDIDHVVALGDAWQMGAAQWSDTKRHQFANDPLNLVATTQHWNRQKGDANAASWLPPTNRCSYVARQAAVKHKYGLAVTAPERDAMNRVLQACPNQPLPTGTELAPRQKSSSSPAAKPTPPTRPAAPKTTKPAPKTSKPAPKTTKPKPAPKTTKPKPAPKTTKPKPAPKTDPQFRTCTEAKRHGYGPYVRGADPEYNWYRDRDHDGIVCE